MDEYLLGLGEITDVGSLKTYLIDESARFGAAAISGSTLTFMQTGKMEDWTSIVSTFPEPARDFYKKHALTNDPFIEAALVRGAPIQYTQIREQLNWTADQRKFTDILMDFGLRDGVGTIVYPKPGYLAYFFMAFDEEKPVMSRYDLRRIYLFFSEFYVRYQELRRNGKPPISLRERQILIGIMNGKSKTEISESLGLSAHTIDTYTRRCFEKLNVRNRTEAAVKAFGLGLAYAYDEEK